MEGKGRKSQACIGEVEEELAKEELATPAVNRPAFQRVLWGSA